MKVGEARILTEQDRINEFDSYLRFAIPDKFREWLITEGFFLQAASSKFHGCYMGGLYDHSATVMKRLVSLTEKLDLTWTRKESPFIIGMLHDLCKIDQYIFTSGGFKFNKDMELHGHGEKSVVLISRFMELTKEEQYCIRYHMGALVDEKEWSKYMDAVHSFPNVFFTHNADLMAAHIDMT